MQSVIRPMLSLVAALAPLGAQSLKEALAALPSDVSQIEIYRDAATLDARFAATLGSFPKPKKSLVAIYDDLELAPGARAAGPGPGRSPPRSPAGGPSAPSPATVPGSAMAAGNFAGRGTDRASRTTGRPCAGWSG